MNSTGNMNKPSTGPLDSSALTAATTATAVGAPARARIDFKPRKYRPVDVFSWPEAGRVFTGFFLVVVFAAITAGLLAVYEVKYVNKTDRDLRDMLFDRRLMNRADTHYHKYFINALFCCNSDPVVFSDMPEACSLPPPLRLLNGSDRINFNNAYGRVPPWCPPKILMQCPGSLTSTACQQTRVALYRAAGMDPVTGAYTVCAKSGKVLVGAEQVGAEVPPVLAALFNGTLVGQIIIDNPFNINQTQVQEFLDNVVLQYGDPQTGL